MSLRSELVCFAIDVGSSSSSSNSSGGSSSSSSRKVEVVVVVGYRSNTPVKKDDREHGLTIIG